MAVRRGGNGADFGYGSYRFELDSDINNLDPNVVLGLFTWSDDPAWEYRQIDIECSRWTNPADTDNSQFVVSPYYLNGHLVRYRTAPILATRLTSGHGNPIAFFFSARPAATPRLRLRPT